MTIEFKKGDPVIYKGTLVPTLTGKRGIVLHTSRNGWIVCEFDEMPGKFALANLAHVETRFIKANVRQEGAQGRFDVKIFELTLPVGGDMAAEAIAAMRAQGFETEFIISHATRRDCL